MSRAVSNSEYSRDFELGDTVEFDGPYGERMTGEVARVYNTRTLYHVEVNGERYEVEYPGDNMVRVK